jgi:Ca-activated chloride channel family protein
LLKYKIILGTFPALEIDDVSLSEGKHNIVYANCARGKLLIGLKDGYPADFNPKVIVKNSNNEIVNVQSLNESISYLTGNYNIEILSLPIIKLNTDVEADKTTSIRIDSPGILSIQKTIRIYGFIYKLIDNEQVKILDINENSSKSESVYLQPGFYRFVYRPIYSSQSVFTQIKDFQIISSKTKRIKL